MTQSFKVMIFAQTKSSLISHNVQKKKWNHTQILKKVQTDESYKNMQIMVLY